MLSVGSHLEDKDDNLFNRTYKEYLLQTVDDILIAPLCTDIENDLRLQIHTHLSGGEMDAVNPLTMKTKQLGDLLTMKPLNIYGERVDLKQRVTYFLENDFYNLTTVFLDDFQKNVEMRNLAFDKYGLMLQGIYSLDFFFLVKTVFFCPQNSTGIFVIVPFITGLFVLQNIPTNTGINMTSLFARQPPAHGIRQCRARRAAGVRGVCGCGGGVRV